MDEIAAFAGQAQIRREQLPGALQEQERGMTLVEVPDRRIDAESTKRSNAADASSALCFGWNCTYSAFMIRAPAR